MALAADQLALALRRDQLREEAVRAEVSRRSDAFKSALLESVSHDLRTPLASIRATADNLADPAGRRPLPRSVPPPRASTPRSSASTASSGQSWT